MRGCGTVFNDDPENDLQLIEAVELLASQWELRAAKMRTAIAFCKNKSSTEGLLQMVAYAFNANQFTPQFGGGSVQQLPPGRYKGVAVNSGGSDTKEKTGGFLFWELTPIEGALTGKKQTVRFNVHNTNPQTVEIAQKQLSAFSHAIGLPGWNQTEELHNKPFFFDVDWQGGHEPGGLKDKSSDKSGGYTEVTAVYDINGNEPGKTGANGPQTVQGGQQGGGFAGPAGGAPGGVQPSNPGAAGGFGQPNQGAGPGQGGFGGGQQGGQPNAGGFGAQGGQGGGFGGQQGGDPNQGQQGGFGGQPNQGGQQGGGFGGGQGGGQPGGWSQGQGGNGQGWNNA